MSAEAALVRALMDPSDEYDVGIGWVPGSSMFFGIQRPSRNPLIEVRAEADDNAIAKVPQLL